MRTSNASGTVRVGAMVVTADGKQLGHVKDVKADRFLVDVRWAPDYWLGTETIESISDESVELFISKQAVGSAKLHMDVRGPGLDV
jgi:hypothetical protein